MPRIHKQHYGPSSRTIEEGVCDLTELHRPFTGASVSCVSISRQIHQVTGLHRSASHAIDVGQSRLARSGAGSRQRLANERVDQARLTYVRSPDHSHFRQPVTREITSTDGARHELRDYLHDRWLTAPGVRLSCPSGRDSVQDRHRTMHGMVQSPESGTRVVRSVRTRVSCGLCHIGDDGSGGNARRQRPGQRNLQHLVHRRHHVHVERVHDVLGDVG